MANEARKELYHAQKVADPVKYQAMLDKKKANYQKNKGELQKPILCTCGTTYTKNHKKRHLETNLHKERMLRLESKDEEVKEDDIKVYELNEYPIEKEEKKFVLN